MFQRSVVTVSRFVGALAGVERLGEAAFPFGGGPLAKGGSCGIDS
jgi:hypothetical protein